MVGRHLWSKGGRWVLRKKNEFLPRPLTKSRKESRERKEGRRRTNGEKKQNAKVKLEVTYRGSPTGGLVRKLTQKDADKKKKGGKGTEV